MNVRVVGGGVCPPFGSNAKRYQEGYVQMHAHVMSNYNF